MNLKTNHTYRGVCGDPFCEASTCITGLWCEEPVDNIAGECTGIIEVLGQDTDWLTFRCRACGHESYEPNE